MRASRRSTSLPTDRQRASMRRRPNSSYGSPRLP
jgi:hypothetical protein